MKKILYFVAALAMAAPAFGQSVIISITNDTPSSPRVTTTAAFIRRASYTVDGNFRISPGTALDISGRTVELKWKPVNRLQDSPCPTVLGTAWNATGGTGRVVIPADTLNVVGDTIFAMTAYNATNRATIFWQSTVYDDPAQLSDDVYTPPTAGTNYYTQAQVDALLTNFMDKTVADGRFVNETNGSVSAWYVYPTGVAWSVISGTNVQLLFESTDRALTNRFTKAEANSNFVNHGEASSITGGMITDATIETNDLSSGVNDHFVDTAGDNMSGALGISNSTPVVLSLWSGDIYAELDFFYTQIVGFTNRLVTYQNNLYFVPTGGGAVTNYMVWRFDNDGAGTGADSDLSDGKEALRWFAFTPTNTSATASNYTIAVASPTNRWVCYTNNWGGIGTNWLRIVTAPY